MLIAVLLVCSAFPLSPLYADELEVILVEETEVTQESFSITATADEGSLVDPLGTVEVIKGDARTFTFSALPGYVIVDVLVDDVSQGALESYTFEAIAEHHTLSVTSTVMLDEEVDEELEVIPEEPDTSDDVASEDVEELAEVAVLEAAVSPSSDSTGTILPNGYYFYRASGGGMFAPRDIVLISQGGSMQAIIALSGSGYSHLYLGTAEEAAQNTANWIPFTQNLSMQALYESLPVNSAGYTYVVPIASLDTDIALASRSAKTGTWANRTLHLNSADFAPLAFDNACSLADGTYTPSSFSATSNEAGADTIVCTGVSVRGGRSYVSLQMSSMSCPYVLVPAAWQGGSGMIQFNTSGLTTVEVPLALNTDVTLIGNTIAGAAYETTYTVRVDVDTTVITDSYTIQAQADSNSHISPEGAIEVMQGQSQTFTFSAAAGYVIKDVFVDSVSQGALSTYTFTDVHENHTILVVSKSEGSTAPGQNPGTNPSTPDIPSQPSTNGSTSAINSMTSLADGVYTPDRFGFSGGTGRVTLSCPKVTITNGQAFATIVFSSNKYTYVKAAGGKFTGTNTVQESIFEIPVQLNVNNRIIGNTVAMSYDHEVEYTIFIYIAGADGAGVGSPLSSTSLSAEPPAIVGLEYVDEVKVEHSELFKMFKYGDGIMLIEIDTTKGTHKSEAQEEAAAQRTETEQYEEEALPLSDEETGEILSSDDSDEVLDLYFSDIVRYLVVPFGVEVPAGIDEEFIVIKMPNPEAQEAETRDAAPQETKTDEGEAEAPTSYNLYASSNDVLSTLDTLGLAQQIALSGVEKDDCLVESVSELMKTEEIVYAGSYDALDYRDFVKKHCGLAIVANDILPQELDNNENKDEASQLSLLEQHKRLEKIINSLSTLDTPLLFDRSDGEDTVLAQAEWLKVYGIIFGCEDSANELFQRIVLENTQA